MRPMSKNTSLKNILLGFLNIYSMTGYELKQLIDNSINHFWSVNLSQIYPTLSSMKEEGLLDMDLQINDGTPNSKIYHITEKGKAELEDWMQETTPLSQTRNLFLAKLLVGAKFDKEVLLVQLQEQLRLHEEKQREYKESMEGVHCPLTERSDLMNKEQYKLCLELAIDAGIHEEEAAIEWCKRAIKSISQLD
jgi:DNA-binding PadR family transcriptional regulator